MTGARSWVVLITDPLAAAAPALLSLQPEFDVRLRSGLDPAGLAREIAEADALIVRSGTRVTAELLAVAPRLRVIGRAGTGVDNIDLPAATRRGVLVLNTPGGNTVAACEHVFALLLALLRHVPAASAELAAGVWKRNRHQGRELYGKVMGVVGMGRIGREVASRARAFGMTVLAADPFLSAAAAGEENVRLVSFETLLAEADVVTLHLPLTEATRHLIDAPALARMKPSAVLVNCARGGLVDEAALAEALDRGKLAGAALDVFANEPPTGSPLLRHPRVLATPHLGASTEEAQERVAVEIAEQVRDYLLHGTIRNAVNAPAGAH